MTLGHVEGLFCPYIRLYLIIQCIPNAGKALIYYQTTNFKLLRDYFDKKISKS